MPAKKEEVTEEITLNFKQKLSAIQAKIKAPKNLYNKFGEYHYRNAEGILEAVKPFLNEYNLYLTIHDEIELIGDRYYVKAVAELGDCDTAEQMIVVAYARETAEKTKMDASQITGAASSYARKYALNGLFLLDDTKDADTDEYAKTTGKGEPKKEVDESQFKAELKALWDKASNGADGFDEWYSKNTEKGFTTAVYANMKALLLKQINKQEEKGEKK